MAHVVDRPITEQAEERGFEKRLACVIKADGGVVRGYLIDSCRLVGANEYVITWKIPLQGDVKTNFAGTIGSALGEEVQPGFITVGLGKDPGKTRNNCWCTRSTPRASRRRVHSTSPHSGTNRQAAATWSCYPVQIRNAKDEHPETRRLPTGSPRSTKPFAAKASLVAVRSISSPRSGSRACQRSLGIVDPPWNCH
jgi:hypothetical protein